MQRERTYDIEVVEGVSAIVKITSKETGLVAEVLRSPVGTPKEVLLEILARGLVAAQVELLEQSDNDYLIAGFSGAMEDYTDIPTRTARLELQFRNRRQEVIVNLNKAWTRVEVLVPNRDKLSEEEIIVEVSGLQVIAYRLLQVFRPSIPPLTPSSLN